MKPFMTSQFSYCPLIWVFQSRRLNNKLSYILERALGISYQGDTPIFQELLNRDNRVSVHHRNFKFQVLATEMFKVHQGLSPEILAEIFVSKTSLRNCFRNDTFERLQVHSIYRSTESLLFLGPKKMEFSASGIETIKDLDSFKLIKIKNWILFESPCRLRKTYIQQVGFL